MNTYTFCWSDAVHRVLPSLSVLAFKHVHRHVFLCLPLRTHCKVQLRLNSIVYMYVLCVYIYLGARVDVCHFQPALLGVPTPKLNKQADTLPASSVSVNSLSVAFLAVGSVVCEVLVRRCRNELSDRSTRDSKLLPEEQTALPVCRWPVDDLNSYLTGSVTEAQRNAASH